MIEETHEDFGRDDRNFHPEEQRIIWGTMENKEPAVDLQQESKNDKYHDQTDGDEDPDNDNSKTQDIELDKELKGYSDPDFDKKDKSDS